MDAKTRSFVDLNNGSFAEPFMGYPSPDLLDLSVQNCVWRLAYVHIALVLCGCNTPTPPYAIPVARISTAPYEKLDCSRLAQERARLLAAEQRLIIAQEERISSSRGHAAFYGWGRGDGMETVELAKVRGERNAVERTELELKCTPK